MLYIDVSFSIIKDFNEFKRHLEDLERIKYLT